MKLLILIALLAVTLMAGRYDDYNPNAYRDAYFAKKAKQQCRPNRFENAEVLNVEQQHEAFQAYRLYLYTYETNGRRLGWDMNVQPHVQFINNTGVMFKNRHYMDKHGSTKIYASKFPQPVYDHNQIHYLLSDNFEIRRFYNHNGIAIYIFSDKY